MLYIYIFFWRLYVKFVKTYFTGMLLKTTTRTWNIKAVIPSKFAKRVVNLKGFFSHDKSHNEADILAESGIQVKIVCTIERKGRRKKMLKSFFWYWCYYPHMPRD